MSAASAVQAVAEFSTEIPFWPQLPQRSERESIIGQGLGSVAEHLECRREGYGYQVKEGRIDSVLEILHRSDGKLRPENAAGFYAFERALSAGTFDSAVAVKGQIEGPITLSAYLFHRGRPFLSEPALFAAIAFHVSQIICWQIERMKAAGLPILLFVDEPALCLDVADSVPEEKMLEALAAILQDAKVRGAHAGLHCCAARPFERMRCVKPDILSFDAHEGLDLFFADSHMIDFVHQGGMVAYGIVPTRAGVNALDSAKMFLRWLHTASQAGDPQEFAQRAIITATCGLGLLNESSVAESFGVAHAIGKMIKALAGSRSSDLDDN
jgi:methionine synthase II (cobalamin-independent)